MSMCSAFGRGGGGGGVVEGMLMGVTVAEVGGVAWRVRRGVIGRAFCGYV